MTFKIGDKVRVVKDIPSVDGMLYKGTKAKVDEMKFPDKDLRIIDEVGKIWYVNFNDVKTIKGVK
tara:strand:+ start:312 stop:506 length:195 start_codon:yes stop_codon:yes gene_type:complete